MKVRVFRGSTAKPELVEEMEMPEQVPVKAERIRVMLEEHGLTVDDLIDIIDERRRQRS